MINNDDTIREIPVHNVPTSVPVDQPEWLGLGDVVAWLAARLGIKPWNGCKCDERRSVLNAIEFRGIERY